MARVLSGVMVAAAVLLVMMPDFSLAAVFMAAACWFELQAQRKERE